MDEVDFFDLGSDSPAFMHLRASECGGISIGFAILKSGGLDLSGLKMPRRLGERLIEAAKEFAA